MKKYFAVILMTVCGAFISSEAAAPNGYYDSCEGKKDEALLTSLFSVVASHTNVGYDGLWDVYKDSDLDENGKIWDMYSTKRWSTSSGKCGNYKVVGDCYNREHSFPKSWFSEGSPMKSDAFHVYPTDGKVNGQRSNFPYGECAGGTTLPSSNGVRALGRLGTSTFPGYSGKVFEPDDDYKGDFARTYFYMAAAYKDKISGWSSDMLAGNSYPAYKTWAVNLLLKWHRQDPVSKKETDRNDAVYKHQRNRNPFIDHPELAEYIWGDKKGQAWYADGPADPALAQPVNNSTVDFGITATNYTLSRPISIKGANLTGNVTISLSGSDFTLSQTSVTAAAANAGTSVSVSYRKASAGKSAATLTVSCGNLSSTVYLKAEAVDGIPALPATDVAEDSFTACWMSLGDEDTYQLSVMTGGQLLSGYPKTVSADAEEYVVTGLNPETTYTYTLSSSTRTSNTVSVTTAALIPEVQYTNGNSFIFAVDPGEPSEAAEVWVDISNITENLTVSVNAPFALSTDMTNWAQAITITPDEERFYIRVNAVGEGQYESFITITAGDYVNDEGSVTADVHDTSVPWFVEDFEKAKDGSYGSYGITSFIGNPCTWNINDCGIWKGDKRVSGDYSLRMGKSAESAIETSTVKKSGIGYISFHGCVYGTDADAAIEVEYRPENSATWISAGTVKLTSNSYTADPHKVIVNIKGNNYIRLRQTAGKRANIDDITVSDYTTSGIGDIIADDTLAGWDAYSLNRSLVIADHSEAGNTFHVYNMDGVTVGGAKLHGSQYTVSLPVGVYIVTDGTASRTVVVK